MPNAEAVFETACATHTGLVREHNEDNFLHHPDVDLWAVADGMGGHEGGEVASAAVVDALRLVAPAYDARALLTDCEARLAQANQFVREAAETRGKGAMGTTVVALLAHGSNFACLWSGDSRAYLVRNRVVIPVSRDHSEVQELVTQGVLSEEEARNWPRRNVITRAIGIFEEPSLELRQGALQDEDVFVLCSDGLTGHVEDCEILARVNGYPPADACRALVELTLERGARDNVTVIVVRCRLKRNMTVQIPAHAAKLWGA